MGSSWTYGDVDRLSRDFAAWLQSVVKLPKGTRVALMMPNIMRYPVCMFAVLRAGYVVVNVNPLYTPRELDTSSGFRRRHHRHHGELRPRHSRRCSAKTPVKHVVLTKMGDMLRRPRARSSISSSSTSRNWCRTTSPPKAAVAEFRRQGQHADLEEGRDRDMTIWPSCNTPAARPASQGAMLIHRNIVGNVLRPMPGSSRDRPPRARSASSRRCRCITSSRSRRTASPSSRSARRTC